ncbi:MAG: amidohydrolase family protein [Spirochaetales bacterium]|nr:amidohydrolase family protein [Spirochaetales bacterium]
MKVYCGDILTCDEKNNIFKYLVEDEGRIIFTGNKLPEKYSKYTIEDLNDKALCPSFADTHLHFASMSLFNSGVNVMDAKSNTDIQKALKDFLPKTKAKIIIAFGASPHSVKEKHLLSREELDQVSSDRPIMVVKYDGHACIINTPFIKILPENVKTLRGYDAETGEMNQEAFFAISDFVSNSIPVNELIKSMRSSIDFMASRGIGLMHTVSGVGFPKDLDVDMERYIGRSAQNGFQTRLFFQTMDVEKVKKRKLPRIGGCFATALDGCYGSVDAAMIKPYEDSENYGVLYYTDEEVIDFCKKANRAGLQIEVHAIGDAAFNQATKAIKAALDDYPREDHRHGIIHACLPTEEGLEICKEYKIHIPLQTSFIDWPQEPGSYLKSILGNREEKLNPLRTFVDNEIVISAGSDAPCTMPDPMLWIHNACNHSVKEQTLTIEEAMRMATYWGYWTSFDEKERGSLEEGKIADMVILEKSPYKVPVESLKDIKIEKLYLEGKEYKKQHGSWLLSVLKGFFSSKLV